MSWQAGGYSPSTRSFRSSAVLGFLEFGIVFVGVGIFAFVIVGTGVLVVVKGLRSGTCMGAGAFRAATGIADVNQMGDVAGGCLG